MFVTRKPVFCYYITRLSVLCQYVFHGFSRKFSLKGVIVMWERFEELMKAKKLRIADVSRETGISYSTFTDWKAGRYTPKADKIQKIADFFDVSYEYLTGATNKKKENISTPTLKDNIMRGFFRSLNNNSEFPVYVEDEKGSGKVVKAKLSLEPFEENEMQSIKEESNTNPKLEEWIAFFNELSDDQQDEAMEFLRLFAGARPEARSSLVSLLKTLGS